MLNKLWFTECCGANARFIWVLRSLDGTGVEVSGEQSFEKMRCSPQKLVLS